MKEVLFRFFFIFEGYVRRWGGGPRPPTIMDVTIGSMLTKTQRLILGLFVLLLVDVIWVSSSELTKVIDHIHTIINNNDLFSFQYLYHNEKFNKPFFNTYIKTSLFTIYLLGLCFWPPWREQFNKPATYMVTDSTPLRSQILIIIFSS